MDINAIFFDAGNTLIFIDPAVVLPIFREHGAQVDRKRFWNAEFQARTQLMRRVEEGAFGTENHIWQEYFRNLSLGSGVPENRLERVGEEIRTVHADRPTARLASLSTRPAPR